MSRRRFYADARVKAHTFFLDFFLRAQLGVPCDVPLLMSYPAPPHATSWAPPERTRERWVALLDGEHRSFSDFVTAFRDAPLWATDLPSSLVKAPQREREAFLLCLFSFNRLWKSRTLRVVWTPATGFGVKAAAAIGVNGDLSALCGWLVRLSASDEAFLRVRGKGHAIVHRFFGGSATEDDHLYKNKALCVGPISLLNHACERHRNVQPYLARTDHSIERQRLDTVWKAAQPAHDVPILAGTELFTYYDSAYEAASCWCTTNKRKRESGATDSGAGKVQRRR